MADLFECLGSSADPGQDTVDLADLDESFDDRGRAQLQDDNATILPCFCLQARERVDDRDVDECRLAQVEDQLLVVGEESLPVVDDLGCVA